MSTASALTALARLIRLRPDISRSVSIGPVATANSIATPITTTICQVSSYGVARAEDRQVRRRGGGDRGVDGPDREDVPGGDRAMHVVEQRLVLAEQDRGEPRLHHLLEGLGDHLAHGDEPGGHGVERRCRGGDHGRDDHDVGLLDRDLRRPGPRRGTP